MWLWRHNTTGVELGAAEATLVTQSVFIHFSAQQQGCECWTSAASVFACEKLINRTDEMLKSCFTTDCIHRFRKILSWVLKAKHKERVHCNLLRQLESLCQTLGVLLPFLSEVCYIFKNYHTWNSFWTTQWLDCDCVSASLYMTVVLYDCQLSTKLFQEWLVLPFSYTSTCSASCSAELPHNFKLNWSVF